ncbi:MAG: hypothetical protein AB7O57_09315 [Hyphomicrobiaceae bacterium]
MPIDKSSGRVPEALAEVAVADAPAATTRIYDDIARLAGIPLPALIWRHIATRPDVLAAAWQALRPLYAAGLVQESAWRTVRETLAGETSAVTAGALRARKLGGDTIAAYGRVLASYNRSNPVNIVGVRILLARMDVASPVEPLPAAAPWSPPEPIRDLAPMVPVREIPEAIRRLIDALAADPAIDRASVVPSLYRHLVPWPALIEAIHADLEPRIRSGEVGALLAKVAAALGGLAGDLAVHVPPVVQIAETPGLADTLRRFSGLIPEMVVIGHLLEQGLGEVGSG